MSRRFEGDDNAKDEETLGSFYMGRMQPPPETNRIMPRGLVATVVVLAFVGIIWYAYPNGDEGATGGEVPVIAADTAAYKFKPEDPGGMEIRHQDSTVFNPLVRKDNAQVERLLPRPEEPLDKDNALKTAGEASPPDLPAVNEGLKLEPAGEVEEASAEKVVIEGETSTGKTTTLTELATARSAEEAVVPPADDKKEVAKAPEARQEEPKPAATAPAATSGFYLQLGSFRDAKGADEEWKKMQRRFPQSLSSLSSRTERADLAAKGVWHRLYAGPLPEAKARDICARLKTENPSGCIVRKL